MRYERDDRVAPVEKRAPDEHCARECDSFLPIVSSCRRDEVYPEWMVLARHYYDFFDRALSINRFVAARLHAILLWFVMLVSLHDAS